jgi:hypothetical protein
MKKFFTRHLTLLALLFFTGNLIKAQTINYSTAGSSYTENFDALFNTGVPIVTAASGPYEILPANFAASNAPGWYVERYAGSGTNVSLAVGDGASNSGQHYSFGTGTATDRALGMLASGTRINRSGILLTNNTGGTLNSLTISFTTEMWRRGANAAANVYPFLYKTGATGINDATGFVAVTNLNMVSPNITGTIDQLRDGNNATFRTAVSYTITGITWAAGQVLALRWDDVNEAGTDDALAIDDFSFSAIFSASATLVSTPTTVTLPNTIVGTASGAATYGLTGSNLDGSAVTVTAPANFEVSTDGLSFAASQPVSYTAPSLTATISVRLAATAPAGVYTLQNVSNAGGGATTINVTASGKVLEAEPTIQASNIVISNITNTRFDINWTNGNGSSRIITLRAGATTEVAPADGIAYSIPGTTGTGNTIVYQGSGSGPLTLTGLVPGTNYTVQVYEFNGTAGSNNYNTTTATNNPSSALTTGSLPNLVQSNFSSVSTPLYGSSGTSTRLPVMFYATVSGLSPNTTYRYYTQAAITTDLATAATGAGNSILIDYTVGPVTYTYSSGPSVTTAGNYGKFTTNASGSFRGAFGFVNTGNARFTAGNVVYPSIALAEDVASPSIQYRYALNDGITILAFATTAGPNDGTFIKGASLATVGNVVGLWQSVDGNSIVAARPLSMTLVENPTFLGAPWAASFVTGYDLTAGSWNTIIPNANVNGVRLVQQFNISTGAVIGCDADADGTWPDGAITVNPTGGTTAIQITSTDAPIDGGTCFAILPVKLSSFAVQKSGNTSKISWTTTQELNSREFVIERSSNSSTWTTIATVAAAGNSQTKLTYQFTDNTPAKGINFYRLKLVDADSRFTNSEIKSVLFSNADVVLITPNPASSFVNIYMSKNNNSLSQIIVTDANGKLVQKINTTEQTYQLPTGNYAKGLYVIKVISAESTSTQKVIIQ